MTRRAAPFLDRAAVDFLGVEDAQGLVMVDDPSLGRCVAFGFLVIRDGLPGIAETAAAADLFFACFVRGGKGFIVLHDTRDQTDIGRCGDFQMACHLHAQSIAPAGVMPENVMTVVLLPKGCLLGRFDPSHRDLVFGRRLGRAEALSDLRAFMVDADRIDRIDLAGYGSVALRNSMVVPTYILEGAPRTERTGTESRARYGRSEVVLLHYGGDREIGAELARRSDGEALSRHLSAEPAAASDALPEGQAATGPGEILDLFSDLLQKAETEPTIGAESLDRVVVDGDTYHAEPEDRVKGGDDDDGDGNVPDEGLQ